jgi:acyl-CoA synthetase (AMP-forming)/AMP-acid ligase II
VINLTQGVHRTLRHNPGKLATICGSRRRTHAQFATRVARMASALRQLGMSSGDRVGILSLNSDRYLELYFAVWWGGGVVVPINTRWSLGEIAHALDHCDTRLLVVDDTFGPYVPELSERSQALRTVIHAGDQPTPSGMFDYEQLISDHEPIADSMRHDDDLAAVFYTGGTTGLPKGVMLSHTNLYSGAMIGLIEGLAKEGDIGLHAAPMFHLADGSFSLMLTLRGCTHVMVPGFLPERVLDTIQTETITCVVLAPTMMQMLVDHPELADYNLSSLQTIFYGASPISEALLRRVVQRLPHTSFYQAYGQTEMSPIVSILRPEYHSAQGSRSGKLRSAGQAAACVEVKIVNALNCELPRGEVGEIAARGPGVMQGYWNDAQQTAISLRDGWVHTGDCAFMDEDGFIFVVDRAKDMIVSGGENVYSAEVENAIALHPGVAMCAVVGVPDRHWGEAVHAFVVRKPGAAAIDADAIKAHCHSLIAGYKCPRSVEFRDSLPMTGTGKVLKHALREPYWRDQPRRVG